MTDSSAVLNLQKSLDNLSDKIDLLLIERNEFQKHLSELELKINPKTRYRGADRRKNYTSKKNRKQGFDIWA
jgi:hypothetical protein